VSYADEIPSNVTADDALFDQLGWQDAAGAVDLVVFLEPRQE